MRHEVSTHPFDFFMRKTPILHENSPFVLHVLVVNTLLARLLSLHLQRDEAVRSLRRVDTHERVNLPICTGVRAP